MKTKSFLLLLLLSVLTLRTANAQNPSSTALPCLPLIHGFNDDEGAWYDAETVVQTIALSTGWNTMSTNLEIELQDLKDALLAALPNVDTNTIVIKSKCDGNTTYNGSSWKGHLNVLDETQMYKIKVDTGCEIILQGLPVNPTEHPVIISNGYNWIGYPLSESMSLEEAFAGFAAAGDMIKSKRYGIALYNGTRWKGSLKYLVPGEGYIYRSNTQDYRILTFPSNRE